MQTLKTIEARLVPSQWFPLGDGIATASADATELIWQLSIASTQLCQDLNRRLIEHEDFETWKQQGRIPPQSLKDLWNSVRSNPPYRDLPERFNRSAWLRIESIYTAWFHKQSQLSFQLQRLNRWLDIVQSDRQLVETCGCQLVEIQQRAAQILAEFEARVLNSAASELKLTSDAESPGSAHNLIDELFNTYFALADHNGSVLDRCAIVHLLKNGGKVAAQPENAVNFARRCSLKRQRAERLAKRAAAPAPKVRDLGDRADRALSDGVETVYLKQSDFAAQLANLQRQPNPLPYAVLFYSGDDLEWDLLPCRHPDDRAVKERIFIRFRGLKTYLGRLAKKQIEQEIERLLAGLELKEELEWKLVRRKDKVSGEMKERISIKLVPSQQHLCQQLQQRLDSIDLARYDIGKQYVFEIGCDRRQLSIFQTFWSDWQIYQDKDGTAEQPSIGLFALKSAALLWRETTANGITSVQPYLKCTLDYRQLTAEGAAKAAGKRIEKLKAKIERCEAKQQSGIELTPKQCQDLKRARGQLANLQNSYCRPSKPIYRGNLHLITSVSFSLERVASVAVFDGKSQKIIAYRSLRQLLGRDYGQLSAYRLQQSRNANRRHQQQKLGQMSKISESNRGKHLDRIIAKAIVEVAREFNTSSIVLPVLTGHRENLHQELEAKAEWKYPGDKAKQKEYQKQYKIDLHQWSYGRLCQYIEERAGKIGVPVEFVPSPAGGDAIQIARAAFPERERVVT